MTTPIRSTLFLLSLSWTLAGTELAAQTLIRDVNANRTPRHSDPDGFVAIGNRSYFVATTPAHGRELWVTDGSTAGTRLARDIRPGAAGSNPRELTVFRGEAWFTADDGSRGRELWRTDPVAGAVLASDIVMGPGSSEPLELTAIGNALYMSLDWVVGREPFVLDQFATPRLLRDVHPGPSGGSEPNEFTAFGGSVFFAADDGTHGRELWRTDGTNAGTVMVANIGPGAFHFDPQEVTAISGWLVFSADHPSTGREVWRTNGTSRPTVVRHIAPAQESADPRELTVLGSSVLFTATGSGGNELWRTDGTSANTFRVRDINPGPVGSFARELTRSGNHVYFDAFDGVHGRELWRTDGTGNGTILVRDIRPGSQPAGLLHMTAWSGGVVFAARSHVEFEPWISDGTAQGTRVLRRIHRRSSTSDLGPFAVFGRGLLFRASDGTTGREPWVSDGTTAGTRLLVDLNPQPGQTHDADPVILGVLGNRALFSATDGRSGRELWSTDGTEQGTVQLADIRTGNGSSSPTGGARIGNRILFVANDGASGEELWATDGTTAGTQLVRDIRAGPADSEIEHLVASGGAVFFSADDGTSGRELWVSDGTSSGTRLVRNLWVEGSSRPTLITPFGNGVLFRLANRPPGLWFSDGTTTREIRAGGSETLTNFEAIVPFGDRAVVVAPGSTAIVWITDGTNAGTRRVPFGTDVSIINVNGRIVGADDRAYLSLDTLASGTELWQVDRDGTGRLVADLTPIGSTNPTSLTALPDGRVMFVGQRSRSPGRVGLWISDGTIVGTRSFGPELLRFNILGAIASDATIVGISVDATHGQEPWIADGGNVRLLRDVFPGTGHSRAFHFTRIGTRLVFSAEDGTHGRELHVVPLRDTGAVLAAPFGIGCPARLRVGTESLPRLGSTDFRITLTGARPNAPAAWMLGPARAIDIGFGCTSYVLPVVLDVTVTDRSGRTEVRLPIPANTALRGVTPAGQFVVIDPSGAFAGLLSLSDGLRMLVN